MKNKNASGVFDTYTIFIWMFTIILMSAVSLFIMGLFNDSLQAQPDIPDVTKEMTNDYNNNWRVLLDGALVFGFATLWIGSLVTAFVLDNSPAWFVIFLLLSLVAFFVLPPFANIQYDLSQSALGDGYNALPMSMFISNNVLMFLAAYIISVGVALYTKIKVIG